MSKIRIYELARELGVDNKVVIAKAVELGLPGKISHSNSLEDDEASQIRRMILRQAVGANGGAAAPAAAPAAPSKVVTTKVDKVTGETQSVVERRTGNVILRRRQAPGSGGEAGMEAATEGRSETALEEMAIAHRANGIEEHDDAEVSESLHDEEEVRTDVEQDTEEVVHEAVVVEPEPVATQQHPVSSDESVPVEEPAAPQPVAAEAATPQATVEKKKIGPRVLGKIELPVRKPARTESARPQAGGAPVFEAPARVVVDEEEEKGGKGGAKGKKSRKREISRVQLVDYEGREGRRAPRSRGGRGDGHDEARKAMLEATKPKQGKRIVKIDEAMSVGDLARQMSLKAGEIIAKLMELGVMATINQVVDKDIVQIIAEEFGFQVESTGFDESAILIDETPDEPGDLLPRAPVVTVMGHVDHGKTTLLDTIRKASVAAKEAGGITQHIGAYKVVLEDGRALAFIDTPGHAAFTQMRARGAQITDIVILVVAADDGVMPQTVEAINHAKAAGVPIVVAVNKVDRPDANPDRVKQALLEHGLQPEDWGGDTMFFPVSALKATGIKELLEGVLLQAEVKELKANPKRRAAGSIIEAKQDRGRGVVATVLVKNGTLRVGDAFVAGAESGRIRSMLDHQGERIDEAGPSTPVEITGLSGVPLAGDDFTVVESEQKARQVAANRADKRAAQDRLSYAGPVSLEDFAKRANEAAAEELNIILKADVHGSLEAVRHAVEQLSTPKVRVKVLHSGVGGVNESDVQLSIASKAIIVGFGVRAEARAMADAEQSGVEIRFYKIIYELIDDVRQAMAGLLDPIRQEVRLGRLDVRETFSVPKLGTVAGCYVVDGLIKRGASVRLLRDSRLVFEGKMVSLRRFKDDVREVASGYECGVGLENFNDIKTGDVLEAFEYKEVAATLD